MNTKAQAGIGTLIMFIALILVAAIAAGVLIQTTSSLQSKALDTGRQTRTQVSTSVMPLQVYVLDTSNISDPTTRWYNHTFLKMRLAAGSGPIRLSDALLQVDTELQRSSLRYNATVDCADIDALSNATNQFGSVFVTGDTTNKEYIRQGDVIELCFISPAAIHENSNIRMSFVPRSGQGITLDILTPQVMINFREEIYP